MYHTSCSLQNSIVANWIAAGDYVKQMQQYNDNHHLVFDSFNLDTKETRDKTPGKIYSSHCESSSRDYMKYIIPTSHSDDTPFKAI